MSKGNAPAARAASTLRVPAALAGQRLDRALRTLLAGESWNDVRRYITTGKISLDGQVVLDGAQPVAEGQELKFVPHAPRPGIARRSTLQLFHLDTHVVVVEKPAGISTVPYDENEHDTLEEQLFELITRKEGRRKSPLGVVHRLDKETSGLVVFARTLAAKRELKNQFRFHTVDRRYWAIVQGAAEAGTHQSRLVQDRGDGRRGSTDNPILGRDSITHVRVLERLRGATLVECRLETGRTHQIRIHLSEAGHPLLGERVYARDFADKALPAPRVMLHAFELGFEHPATRRRLHFTSEMPADMQEVARGLGGRGAPSANTPGR